MLFAFPSPRWLMPIFGRIIRLLVIDVLSPQAEGLNGDMARSELIGCNPGRRNFLLLGKF